MAFAIDQLVLTPDAIDLARSPLAGRLAAETRVHSVSSPGLARLANGNLLLVARVAETLADPMGNGKVRAIRRDPEGGYCVDEWPLEHADTSDPRAFRLHAFGFDVRLPRAFSWLLPVELSPDGCAIVALHYDRAIVPADGRHSYGLAGARISRVAGQFLLTAASLGPEGEGCLLYVSDNALDWRCDGPVLDHQNREMAIFAGRIGGQFWAQTRPQGSHYHAYPPGSDFHAGPSINLVSSPDGRHWRPCHHPHIRPHRRTVSTTRIGAGAPPLLTEIAGQRGWLSLWHGVEPDELLGIYRTYWTLLDPEAPWKVLATSHPPLIEPAPALAESLGEQPYRRRMVVTTGLVETAEGFIAASGEAGLACRITHIPRDAFQPSEDDGGQ